MSNKAKATLILLPVIIGIALSAKTAYIRAGQAIQRDLDRRNAADMQMLRDKMRQYEQQKMR